MTCLLFRASLAALALAALGSQAVAAGARLWQTNSEGNDVHVFDLESGRLVRRLVVGPEPHGIAAPADAGVVYVTLEANGRPRGELLWIDARSYTVRHRMEICREPHALATTPGGRWIYVPCRDAHYRVVDAERREEVARIRTGGRPHNVQISHDGRLAVLSPMGSTARATVVDVQVVATVEHGTALGWLLVHPKLGWLGPSGLQRCHGLAIRPDQHEIWSACGASVTIHDITAPGYPELARIPLGSKAYWLTFSPDGRWALVALSDADGVAVVDTESRRVVASLPAGSAPKRNLVIESDAGTGALPGEARGRCPPVRPRLSSSTKGYAAAAHSRRPQVDESTSARFRLSNSSWSTSPAAYRRRRTSSGPSPPGGRLPPCRRQSQRMPSTTSTITPTQKRTITSIMRTPPDPIIMFMHARQISSMALLPLLHGSRGRSP